MPQVLSQDEVDALLQGVANDQIPDGEAEAQSVAAVSEEANVVPYDFTRSEMASRGRLPGLQNIFNNFARRLQSLYTSQLGKSADANFEGMEVVSYGSLLQNFPLPASIHLVRLEPMRGVGILVIEARLAFAMVEVFFGGNGHKEVEPGGRDFTPIETRFLGKFVEGILRGMEESWRPVVRVKGRYLRSEMNPYLLNAAGMGDGMIVATYRVSMPPLNGKMLLVLPLSATEEFRDRLKSGFPIGDDSETLGVFKSAEQRLLDIELDVQAVVDVVEMGVGEIMGLRPGDIIQLKTPGLEEIELWVEGKPKFVGKGAQRNGNKVFVTSKKCD